ncbi:MAG: Glyceraldehyde-3-phosphate dehydrogenase 1 [Alphaproteobacteria bacterium MarineAlpha3_Bin5]|nr:MAG: Glyceraldehyde-3-phosphate dehydrogenase 1 [Alphaproteobacteria bacterium MarineAlpha3_Bin5]
MAIKLAINGFGRIGRNVLRAISEAKRSDVEVVAINDLGSVDINAHLMRFDSVHGKFSGDIQVDGDSINIGTGPIQIFNERDPSNLPWKELSIDVALECTGIFTKRADAKKHMDAGAKKVLISAPGTDSDKTIVFGVNDCMLTANDKIVSNASCTTNCLAPVVSVLNKTIGLEKGFMTTVHSYTQDQNPLDSIHGDKRRARACSLSMIPTSTGAARAIGLVLPELEGRLDGTAIRVPTPNVSMIDLTFTANRDTTKEEINAAIKDAANGPLKGVLEYIDEDLVSIDFNHNPASSSFDSTQTIVVGGNFVRVLSWYDNEWGFSNRMPDTAVAMTKAL